MKAFKQINGRLVSVSLSREYPPIPIRTCDWRAWYSNDESDEPNCGWGATSEEAMENLVDFYDYEDTLPSFAELYGVDLFYARLHWQEIDKGYIEFGLRFGIPEFDDSVPF